MLYFCYGSNMLTRRLRGSSPGARVHGAARLPGHTLAFHKRSVDGSGKCNVVEASQHAEVHGTLAEVPEEETAALHLAEFVGAGYELRCQRVLIGQRVVRARVFAAMPEFVDESLRPYGWYKAFVVGGARQHQLPSTYIDRIRSVEAVPDPDPTRAAHNEAILGPHLR